MRGMDGTHSPESIDESDILSAEYKSTQVEPRNDFTLRPCFRCATIKQQNKNCHTHVYVRRASYFPKVVNAHQLVKALRTVFSRCLVIRISTSQQTNLRTNHNPPICFFFIFSSKRENKIIRIWRRRRRRWVILFWTLSVVTIFRKHWPNVRMRDFFAILGCKTRVGPLDVNFQTITDDFLIYEWIRSWNG